MRQTAKILALASAAFALSTCAELQKMVGVDRDPSINFEKIELTGIDLEKLSVRLHTRLDNPYAFALPRAATDFGLEIEGAKLAQLKTDLSNGVAKRSETPIPFDVEIPYKGILEVYQRLPGKETFNVRLNGPAQLFLPEQARLPGLPESMTLDLDQSREIPALRPNIEVRNFSIQKPTSSDLVSAVGPVLAVALETYLNRLLGDGGSPPGAATAILGRLDYRLKTEYELVLKNEAAAQMDFTKVNYALALEGRPFFEGIGTEIVKDELTGASIVKVQTEFPIVSITSSIARAIKYKNANFRLSGDAGLDLPDFPVSDLLKLKFDKAGKLDWQ